MKAAVYDRVKLLIDVRSGFTNRVFPRGTLGTIVECYTEPNEGYAVDVSSPDESLVGGLAYDNIILYPDQFEVIRSAKDKVTTIEDKLKYLKEVCSAPNISRSAIKNALEDIIGWLNESTNNTDENCRKVDLFVSMEIDREDRIRLPKDIRDILSDIGGALHDTHTSPDVAENFESTPRQLLERIRRLKA